MPNDEMVQKTPHETSVAKQDPSIGTFDMPILDRDQFLELYTNFQHDLFREGLSENELSKVLNSSIEINPNEILISLYCVDVIRFRNPGDITNALRLYYQATSRLSFPIIYILKKEHGHICLYLGSYYEKQKQRKDLAVKYSSVAKVLPSILPGFLPGTECVSMNAGNQNGNQTDLNFDDLRRTYKYRRIVFGVPGEQQPHNNVRAKEQSQKKQEDDSSGNEFFGIERVLDAVNEDFMIIGYSEPVANKDILQNQAIFSAAHDLFHLLAKHSEQISKSYSKGWNWNISEMEVETTTDPGFSKTVSSGPNVAKSLKMMWNRWWKGGKFSREQETENIPGDAHSKQKSASEGESENITAGMNASFERTNELAHQTEELLSRQLKRLEKGLATGMWRHTTQVLANQSLTAERVANLLCGYWGGNDLTLAQIRNVKVDDEIAPTLPLIKILPTKIEVIESPFGLDYSGISTLLTSIDIYVFFQ